MDGEALLVLAVIFLLAVVHTANSAWHGGQISGVPISCGAALVVGLIIVLGVSGACLSLVLFARM